MNCENPLTPGQHVKALAGRDKDKEFIVVAIIDSKSVYIADGAKRTIEAPKKKKIKHLQKINLISEEIQQKLVKGDTLENSLIKRELNVSR